MHDKTNSIIRTINTFSVNINQQVITLLESNHFKGRIFFTKTITGGEINFTLQGHSCMSIELKANLEVYVLENKQATACCLIPATLQTRSQRQMFEALRSAFESTSDKEIIISLSRVVLRQLILALESKLYLQHLESSMMNYMRINLLLDYNGRYDLSREQLAESIGICRDQVNHLFRRFQGFSFKKYALIRRIDKSRNLLLKGIKISEICSLLGMSQAPLNRYFKQAYQLRPLQLRKSLREYPQSKLLHRNNFFDQITPLKMNRKLYLEVYAPALKEALEFPKKTWATLMIVNLCSEEIVVKPRKEEGAPIRIAPGNSSWNSTLSRRLFSVQFKERQLYFLSSGRPSQVIITEDDFLIR